MNVYPSLTNKNKIGLKFKAKQNYLGLWLLLFMLSFGMNKLFAQGVMRNVSPAVKWKQLETPNYRIIFPDNYVNQVEEVAETLEKSHGPIGFSLGVRPKKVPVILQSYQAVPNGFVTLGPRRTEFFTNAPQNQFLLGLNNWMDLLAIHEMRHVAQYDKSLVGFNKLFYFLFGEDAQAGMANVAAPAWFWEGDAVYMESALTESGRGRIPFFGALFKANLIEKGPFNYRKQHLRSFKELVPNHYVTGFYFSAWLREQYGKNVFNAVTKQAFSYPFIPFTFSRALKKETGMGLEQNYRAFVRDLEQEFREEIQAADAKVYPPLHEIEKASYIDINYPQQLENGRWIGLRGGIGHINQIVEIQPDKKVVPIQYTGPINSSAMLSAQGRKVTWSEFEFHPRWQMETYSEIKVLDTETRRVNTLRKKSRMMAPALSPSGDKIVAVHNDKNHHLSLVWMESTSGRELGRWTVKAGQTIIGPRFMDDERVVFWLQESGVIHAEVLQLSSGQSQRLFSSKTLMGQLSYQEPYLLYSSPKSGTDNIYAFHIHENKHYQLTQTAFGAFHPQVDHTGQWLYFNQMSSTGMQVSRIAFKPEKGIPLDSLQPYPFSWLRGLEEQEEALHFGPRQEKKPEEWTMSPYRKWRNLILPYAWGPSIRPDQQQMLVGFASRDLLSTTTVEAGMLLEDNPQRFLGYTARLSYQNWFPIVDIGFTGFFNRQQISVEDEQMDLTWREERISTGIRIPLVLTRNKWVQSLQFSSNLGYARQLDFNQDLPNLVAAEVMDVRSRLTFSRRTFMSKRDLNPRWGQSFQLMHSRNLLGIQGEQWAARSDLYFPGLFLNHSSHLRFSRVQNDNPDFMFGFPVPYPRGYLFFPFTEMNQVSTMYRFPLAYTDISLGPFLQIQRWSLNVFNDLAWAQRIEPLELQEEFLWGIGAELMWDFNVMRYLPLFQIGFRTAYRPQDGGWRFNAILGQIPF